MVLHFLTKQPVAAVDFGKHGNTKWVAKQLVMLAVLWVWSEKSQLTAAFEEAAIWSRRLFGSVAVGSYQRHDRPCHVWLDGNRPEGAQHVSPGKATASATTDYAMCGWVASRTAAVAQPWVTDCRISAKP